MYVRLASLIVIMITILRLSHVLECAPFAHAAKRTTLLKLQGELIQLAGSDHVNHDHDDLAMDCYIAAV